jgi:hypothetical protein
MVSGRRFSMTTLPPTTTVATSLPIARSTKASAMAAMIWAP